MYVPPAWAPRVPWRFDPATPDALAALAVWEDVWRCMLAGVPPSPELRLRWSLACRRAAFGDRKRRSAYSDGSAGIGEVERLAAVTEGCMRLAAARVARERSGSVTP